MANKASKSRDNPVVAVTGASEYLGRRLVEHLQAGRWARRICVVDVREPPCSTGPRTRSCPVDLTQPEAGSELTKVFRRNQVDILVHLAFISHPVHDTEYAHELQVIGTLHLLNAASAARLKKVVLLGDSKAYGARPDNPNFLDERQRLRGVPHSPLVADLVEVEQQFESFAARHPDTVCTVLRMGNILSREVDGFIPRLLRRTLVPTVLGYDPPMQFLHHDDAFQAIRLAVEGDHPGAFNITSDGLLALTTAIRLGGRLTLPFPYCLWQRAGSVMWAFQALEVPPSLVDYLRFQFVADGQRVRKVMGFRPTMSSKQTLLDFYRSSGPAAETSWAPTA